MAYIKYTFLFRDKGEFTKLRECCPNFLSSDLVKTIHCILLPWTIAKKKNLTHFRIPGYDVKWTKPKVYHLQHVNNTHSKLKEWIRTFHGVSDKYMTNYLSYYRILESSKKYNDPNKSYREMSLSNNAVYIPIQQIKEFYQKQLYSI